MIIITILSTIVVLGLIIFLHELGHFSFAKLFGVRVYQFSLGFPPKAISKKIGETEYALSWIPFGGYVRMAGEEEDVNESWSFSAKKAWQKFLIIFGGPLSNMVSGILILFIIFLFAGEQIPDTKRPIVGDIVAGTPASMIKLQPNDSIISINNTTVLSWNEMTDILKKNPDNLIYLSISRNNQVINDSVKLSSRLDNNGNKYGVLGIYPTSQKITYSPIIAFTKAFGLAYTIVKEMVKFILGIFSGKPVLKEIGGPILIAELAGKSARMGLSSFLAFLAILSINLAFINLLPLPMLDGGQIIIYGIEGITRRKFPIKAKEFSQKLGFILLLLLMVLVTFNDILRLFHR